MRLNRSSAAAATSSPSRTRQAAASPCQALIPKIFIFYRYLARCVLAEDLRQQAPCAKLSSGFVCLLICCSTERDRCPSHSDPEPLLPPAVLRELALTQAAVRCASV